MIIRDDFNQFCNNFNIVNNALDMRNLIRWNGRPILRKENLSEHTHLVVACAIWHIETFSKISILRNKFSNYKIVKAAMLHDSLEILRGDILSITKDNIPAIRQEITEEENKFQYFTVGDCNDIETRIVRLSDLMACYKFLENELQYPNNDYAKEVYISCKQKYDDEYCKFCEEAGLALPTNNKFPAKLEKGYYDDCGVDVLLTERITFMPLSTQTVNLKIHVTPKENEMGFLCARTSAANKGLSVAMCPIDPNYSGDVMAIVHNVSNKIITYEAGEGFAQVVMVPFINNTLVPCRKSGKRGSGNLGSTGRT